MRFELTRYCYHKYLKLARLPFRHSCKLSFCRKFLKLARLLLHPKNGEHFQGNPHRHSCLHVYITLTNNFCQLNNKKDATQLFYSLSSYREFFISLILASCSSLVYTRHLNFKLWQSTTTASS